MFDKKSYMREYMRQYNSRDKELRHKKWNQWYKDNAEKISMMRHKEYLELKSNTNKNQLVIRDKPDYEHYKHCRPCGLNRPLDLIFCPECHYRLSYSAKNKTDKWKKEREQRVHRY